MRQTAFHNIFLLIYICISVLAGCTVKRKAQTEIKSKADYSEITDELSTQHTQLDKVTETMSKTKEQIAEWLNENVNYEEQKYDSLGRLISTIKQTTNRNGGSTVVKQGDTYVYEGVTISQVDSILSAQMKQLRSELVVKNKTVEKDISIPVIIFWIIFALIVAVCGVFMLRDRARGWLDKLLNWLSRIFKKR